MMCVIDNTIIKTFNCISRFIEVINLEVLTLMFCGRRCVSNNQIPGKIAYQIPAAVGDHTPE